MICLRCMIITFGSIDENRLIIRRDSDSSIIFNHLPEVGVTNDNIHDIIKLAVILLIVQKQMN